MLRSPFALLPVLAVAALSYAPANAENYKVTTCPPNKSYCTQVTKPILSPEEIAKIESGTSEVAYDRGSETRKARARESTGYRDVGAVAVCPPPHHMTAMDGCQ
jgi:hypothetical protein